MDKNSKVKPVFHMPFMNLIERAAVVCELGKADQPILVQANTLLTPDYFEGFQLRIEELRKLPGISERRQAGLEITALRNEDMDEAKALLQSLFRAGKQAGIPGDPFGRKDYQKSRRSPEKLLALLRVACQQANSDTYKEKLLAAGFPEARLLRLSVLAPEAGTLQTDRQAFGNSGTTVTSEIVAKFNAVWINDMRVLRHASLSAPWPIASFADRYKLYDHLPERRSFTLKPGERKHKRLEHALPPGRVLTFLVKGDGLEAALVAHPQQEPQAWTALPRSRPRSPLRLTVAELGEGPYLVLRNTGPVAANALVTLPFM